LEEVVIARQSAEVVTTRGQRAGLVVLVVASVLAAVVAPRPTFTTLLCASVVL
jgi:hypothetical protein